MIDTLRCKLQRPDARSARAAAAPRFLCLPLLCLLLLATSCTTVVDRAPMAKNTPFEAQPLHYTVSGAGETTLTLVHGWACDQRTWWKNAPLLAEHFRVIAVDLPGHGRNAEPRAPYSMSLFARGIATILDAEGVDSTILVAHSNGVPTVRQFYRLYPQRVDKLVLVDGAMKNMLPEGLVAQFTDMFRKPEFRDTVHEFVQGMAKNSTMADADRDALTDMAVSQAQHAVVGGFQAAADPAIWNADPIHVPVLMINAQQPAWDDAYEREVRALIPDLDYRIVGGVSHFLMVEMPEEFAAWVREFAG